MRKIAKGEEITISYITPFLSAEERLKALFTEYAFICQCHRCNEESEEQENLFNNSILYAQVGKAKSKLQALLKSVAVGAEELDGVETKMREICSASGRAWPMNASPLPELYEVLAETLQRQQRWEKALQICLKRVFIIDPLCLRERLNPLRVKHLIDLCQVEAYVALGLSLINLCLDEITQRQKLTSYCLLARFHEPVRSTLDSELLFARLKNHCPWLVLQTIQFPLKCLIFF